MKKVILATAIALCTTSAFAGETAVMKVTGILTNAACTPALGNGGVIDYGYIRLGELSDTSNNKLGQKQIPVTISCTMPTKVGFTITDNRSDSNAQLPVDIGGNMNQTAKYYTYGIGLTNDGKKIGNYGMWMTGTTVDGKSVDSIAHNHDWGSTTWKKSGIPRSDAFQTIAFADTGTTTPMAITTANFNFVTNLVIWDTSTLAITDDTALDGQNTMTLVYL
ncbi:DUF1120 domain-containing protein [Enterobacter cloacae subsp. cloacae]|uniref:DUF1120 domain-containing protein n=1 Tax=Enterobacter cloacae TaxID=550 RepID=UPI001981F301|nr:DUF1120 domain-containing protein [Enterobacter cloacae]MBN4757843.1 DUF1120 domain-containing protein [Enterobacter cloacae]MCU6281098.1 DUF1120 domain-containing protein [Enterobacter cloacae]MCU6308685.1 DUF1120 domain-containing protein [Enterobacter cloacae]WLD33849.1 DUF1120 domain-containing protein [Enterobacter cloacae subsp. cloacae]HDC4527985.1 DUF1120 domain-containing protein [Enterobacter cloacae]